MQVNSGLKLTSPLRVRSGSRSERKANDLAFRATNARSPSVGRSAQRRVGSLRQCAAQRNVERCLNRDPLCRLRRHLPLKGGDNLARFIIATPAFASGHCQRSGSGAHGRAFLMFGTWRDFRAPPAISVPVRSAAPCLHSFANEDKAYVLVQHARAVLPAGEPLDGTSPALRLRLPQDGSAGSSPQITVATGIPMGGTEANYERCSKGEDKSGVRKCPMLAKTMGWKEIGLNSFPHPSQATLRCCV